ncbi:AbfB domain-containing protein [Actinomadura opuntiae]|uniref:AbfB domain-containing protein n=1 Tax=Actinomadura sp. OS1-43 TaxID=604315 RepID=UPI00255A7F72|nr:AbfB domain-containing protein [Actinomadura sp. OS1-43]MDL4818462.1 AbfB domain-containing protein [Actinomadura sp. OS1-43]
MNIPPHRGMAGRAMPGHATASGAWAQSGNAAFRALTALSVALIMLGAMLVGAATAQADHIPKTPPLTTPWTSQVSRTDPLPEYPRPQLTRPDWQSLNGQWQFAATEAITSPPVGQNLAETVLVPYPIESALSGIMRHENNMWYRRTFTVPAAWSGKRIQLNFGAVTWRANVWVNGVDVGTHSGGYDAFSFDITDALHSGDNEIIVGVYSPVDAAGNPIGKQRLNPSGIFYTASSGIWQTVWLEPTTPAHITRLDTTPDVPARALDVVAHVGGGNAQNVHAEVIAGGKVVGSADGSPGSHLRIPVPNAHLWSPDDPYLYDLRVSLTGTGGGDVVGGYVGMRSIGKAVVGGVLRPVINGKFVFQMGTLDQGYWPDGIYTAPTDDALKFDLQQEKALGFNMVRKHIKVEPARWFYWADKLGLMVWQDMPAMRTGTDPSSADRANFESELHRVVDQLKGITSIVQWIPFNEGWGEYDSARIADLVKSWDPSRLVDNNSGSNCCGTDGGNGDVVDDHIYVGPGQTHLPTSSRVAVLGEYGGLGLRVSGHEWSPGNGFSYEMEPDSATLTQRYVAITGQLRDLITTRGLSASVYTEPTDVENEVNGFYTYDRRVQKMDFAQVLAVNNSVKTAAQGQYLPIGSLTSFKVTTPGYTDRSLSLSGGLGITAVVNTASSEAARRDATFWVRSGLADPSCVSLESRGAPGQFLRHFGYRARRDANDGSSQFAQDATFCVRSGLSGGGSSLESYNYRGRYLRHINSEVYISDDSGANAWDAPAGFAADATWSPTTPWWRSGADLPTGQAKSLQVVTPGYTDRYLRHKDGLGYTDVVNAAADAGLKGDATFIIRAGLADSSCYSFESRNYSGHYLRHQNFRIRKDPRDGSALFDQDATFCAQPGRYGSGDVTLASYNEIGHNIRHYAAQVWVASNGGPSPCDSPSSYDPDVTWHLAAPWTP